MEKIILKRFDKIKKGGVYKISAYDLEEMNEKEEEIYDMIKRFIKIHNKKYKKRKCEVYNEYILWEILKFLGIDTGIDVCDNNYVIMTKNKEGYCEDGTYFNIEKTPKIVSEILKEISQDFINEYYYEISESINKTLKILKS